MVSGLLLLACGRSTGDADTAARSAAHGAGAGGIGGGDSVPAGSGGSAVPGDAGTSSSGSGGTGSSAAAGSTTVPDAGGGGDDSSTAGAGGSDERCYGFNPKYVPYKCVNDCNVSPEISDPVCIAGEIGCNGGIRTDQCPRESCIVQTRSCCNLDNGHWDLSPCGPDGARLPCTGNTTPPGQICKPDSVDVTNCEQLTGQACSPEQLNQQCHNPGKCVTSCTCLLLGDDYVWNCAALAC